MNQSVGQCLKACPLPLLEARALLQWASGLARETLIAHPERLLEAASVERFTQAARQRQSGVPLAYLVGVKEFYGRPFRVSPDVLIPRPETEQLIERALERIATHSQPRILDLGTGSGCLAISLALELPGAEVHAIDLSAPALEMAHSNAQALGAQVAFTQSHWFENVQGPFDLIVANPPYIEAADPHLPALRFEPRSALTDNADGLSALRHIIQTAPRFLSPGGWLITEHGHDQGPAVQALYTQAGFQAIQSHHDLAGLARLCLGQRH
ncbi:MAG TPA: peptide chain release factor N(5)-glutamine methyltransferase [Burkholderiaceae bacterium]|nr:peptide chain release factor N(5)-glutamine methyltransferase [Burkholderiaceae bacterium]